VNIRLAPSILAADFAALGSAIAAAERGGADLIHVDVMDGQFVPNITIGPPVVRSLHRVATVPLDVHLMIAEPDRYVEAFVNAGAGMLSVHVEVLPHLKRTLGVIKRLGVKAGAVLNPDTPVGALADVTREVDFVLVMTVNPGFGGQTFLASAESKIREARRLLDEAGNAAPVEVDGGIDLQTVRQVVSAGAEILVAGSAVFGAADPEAAARELKAVAVAHAAAIGGSAAPRRPVPGPR